MPLTPGARLGPYEVVAAVGAGGMGDVYRARDTRLDRTVALKVLRPGTADDPQVRDRFAREARAISSLAHPHICVLHDVGRERPAGHAPAGDAPLDFLVMEYLEGETLAARLARGPLPIGEAIDVAIQIARALDAAHRQGIVHRDLKPGNVMLTKPPASSSHRSPAHVKLLDFGIARLAPPPAVASDREGAGRLPAGPAALTLPTASSPLTLQGTIVGTPQYMSPEQLEGKPVDARADIFAFGAVLYEMIAGRRPFEAKSQAGLVEAILDHDPPSVAAVRPATPPLLAELVSRCLAKDREERWQSSRDLWRQLEAIAAHAAGGAATSSAGGETRTGTRRTIAILLAVAAVSGGMVAWALWPEPGPPALVSRLVADLPERQTFTRTGRRILALSPDGSHLAYVANQELYLRRLDDLTASPIRGTAATDPSEPAFSPDGRWIAFWSNGALWKVPVAGGAPARLAPAENPTGMSWQADRILVGQGASGIIDVPAAGGDPIRLITLDPARQELAQSPHRVAGGRAVLFTLRTGAQGWDDAEIVVQDLASGRRSVLVAGGTDARVSPGGHLIYAREGTLFAAAFDDASLRVSGTAKAVQPDVEAATGGFTGTAQFALSNSGTLAFVPGRSAPENRLVWIDRQGRTARPALPARRYKAGSAHMRISPDGTRAALTMLAAPGAGQANPGQDIWVWGLARDSLTRLTFTSSAASPVWTPDSRRICFNSASEVFCQAADGSGQPQPMFRVDRLLDLAQVSPDGRRILMEVGDADERSDIVMAPLQPGAQVQPVIATPASDESPSLSPDGRWLVYESNESGASQVYLRPFPEVSQGRWQLSTAGGVDPSWSRDGREVIFLEIATSGAAQPRAILSVSIPPGPPFVPAAPRLVVKYPANAARGFAEAADGRFLLSVPASSGDDEPAARPRIVVVQNWREELARLVPVR